MRHAGRRFPTPELDKDIDKLGKLEYWSRCSLTADNEDEGRKSNARIARQRVGILKLPIMKHSVRVLVAFTD
jgi:hypothetical protein